MLTNNKKQSVEDYKKQIYYENLLNVQNFKEV